MKILISILSVIIATILIITYVKISKPEIETKHVIKKENITKITTNKGLNFSFSTYSFPAREMFMKIDFKEYKNIILYKVIINSNDKYGLFNIRAILDNLNIAYSVLEKKKTEIFILFHSLNEAERVFNIFKSYKLNIKIQKIIKRI